MPVIRPIHHSITGKPRMPANMTHAKMQSEDKERLTNMVLEMFTDCVNVGQPFQVALLAIYLSGLQHGAAIAKEQNP